MCDRLYSGEGIVDGKWGHTQSKNFAKLIIPMAITDSSQSKILRLVDEHWSKRVRTTEFAQLISGKEPGHRMADYVDDQTTSLLKISRLITCYEARANGEIKKRSMGDVWVKSDGIFNPVNVKSGLWGMNGQPNVVAMQKLLDYIFNRWIDSYYLLIIKFKQDDEITHKSYLIDLLDWIDFIAYDAGPGQIMLCERDFYEAFDSGQALKKRTIIEKIESLFQLFEKQLKVLFTNRVERLERQKCMLKNFRDSEFTVDQSDMEFVP